MTVRVNPQASHPAGQGRGRLAPVVPIGSPAPAGPGMRIEPASLAWLAELYGTSCVTPWCERDEPDPLERRYELVELSCDFEVWVIHWPRSGVLQLHDHGGSGGALFVVSGTLEEGTVTGGAYDRRQIPTGRGISFGPGHVHDVVNPGPDIATSVHVYSPPMESMTFFTLADAGVLPIRTEHRSDRTWDP